MTTTDIATKQAGTPTRDLKHSLEWLDRFNGQLIRSESQANEVRAHVDAVSTPATPEERAMAAVTASAFHWTGQGIPGLDERVSAIWLAELKGLPQWAIDQAVADWVGRKNPAKNRGRKPMPGDISEMAEAAMAPVYRARLKLDWWEKHGGQYPSYIERKTAT